MFFASSSLRPSGPSRSSTSSRCGQPARADQISIASNPRAAIRSIACSIGRDEKPIDEQESRIFHLAEFSPRAKGARPPAQVTAAIVAELVRRKLRREYLLSYMGDFS